MIKQICCIRLYTKQVCNSYRSSFSQKIKIIFSVKISLIYNGLFLFLQCIIDVQLYFIKNKKRRDTHALNLFN